MKDKIQKNWIKIALTWLFVISILGITMRFFYVKPIHNINYKFVLHAHSHVALLGWIYSAIFIGIVHFYFKHKIIQYKLLFYLTQLSVLGMLISFPIQGYKLWSILFSSLFIILSYWFIKKVLADLDKGQQQLLSYKYLKSSLFYLIISSIGPWSLGPLVKMGFANTPIYLNTIYFYLHFLYNGFIVMVIISFIYRYIELNNIEIGLYSRRSYQVLHYSIFPTYALSTYWHHFHISIYFIGTIGVILLFTSLFPFLKDLAKVLHHIKNDQNKWVFHLFRVSIFSYCLKIFMQIVSSIPDLSNAIYNNNKFIIIGYLHLVLLGFASIFLISWFIFSNLLISKSTITRIGILLFLLGIVLSEIILFYQGSAIWMNLYQIPNFYLYLFIISTLMPIGIGLFYIGQWNKKKHE